MVVVMRERSGIVPLVRDERGLRCAKCGRFLAERRVHAPLPVGVVWTRVKCPTCERWRWFDLATGEMHERPGGADLTN